MKARFVMVMGVAGSGKTTLGKALALALGWEFYDADDSHPIENITKMASGMPLDDTDRALWLETLSGLIASSLADGRPGVLACSALKEAYRRQLIGDSADVLLVYLKGDRDLIHERITARLEHYMAPQMLASQFEDLEEPERALILDLAHPVDENVRRVLDAIEAT